MKKVFLISLFLCITFSASAQSLQFGVEGVDVINGSEMYYFTTPNELTEWKLHLQLTNTTNEDFNVVGLTTPILNPFGTAFTWCGFEQCWGGFEIPSSLLEAGYTEGAEGEFYAAIYLNSNFDPATYLLTFGVYGNAFDEAHITVTFVDRDHIPDSIQSRFGNPTQDTIVFVSGGVLPTSNTEILKAETFVRVYPNPAIDYVTFDLGNERGNVIIRSATGAIVRTIQNAQGFASTNVNGLAKGFYFYTIESENGRRCAGKLVVK